MKRGNVPRAPAPTKSTRKLHAVSVVEGISPQDGWIHRAYDDGERVLSLVLHRNGQEPMPALTRTSAQALYDDLFATMENSNETKQPAT